MSGLPLPSLKPSRLTPDVLEAIGVILGALFDEPLDLTARAKRWAKEGSEHIQRKAERERHEALQKKRIERAERAVKTRRKNAKKKSGGVKAPRPAPRRTKPKPKQKSPFRNCRSIDIYGDRCLLHGCHRGDHRSRGNHTWHPAQRTKKKRKARQ